ncbi:MAG TPA: cytochrome c3 family protein [Polyangia bacterium]|nr:cytochrome c3 family protein [Polyangia bacterium]
MSALFPPWTNTVSRFSLVCLALGGVVGAVLLVLWVESPYFTGQHGPIEQPVQFDHRHHVADDGIDCRYCHSTVETAASAGFPALSVCMNCHGQIWNKSPMLEQVRAAYFSDRAIPWNRVHRLPDFVYFNHSIHVAKGVGCVSCHGRVDQMAQVTQVAPLTMGWCLGCHRAPEPNLRPREEITHLGWRPPTDSGALGHALVAQYDVHTRVSCSTCHR